MSDQFHFAPPAPRLAFWPRWVVCAVALLGVTVAPLAWSQDEIPANAPPAEADAAPPAPEGRPARLLRLRLPITGNADSAFRSIIDRTTTQLLAEATPGERPVLVIEFVPLAGADGFGQGTDFSRAQSLARYLTSTRMTGVKTIAFIPQSIKGHAVLVALACEEIAMAPTAEIGDAGIDEDPTRPIEPAIVEGYRQIALARHTAPVAIAIGMVDPAIEVLEVETEARVEFIESNQLEELEKNQSVIRSTTLFPAGTMGVATAREARPLGIAKYLVDDRESLAKLLRLREGALSEDAGLVADWHPAMYTLEGPITTRAFRRTQELIDNEIRNEGANWIGIRIKSAGGPPTSATALAGYVAELGSDDRRVVAYVPEEARGTAALVALAADQLIVHHGAVIGGENGRPIPRPQLDVLKDSLRESVAANSPRTWSLRQAMVDPEIEVFRYTNIQTGEERLFCEEQAKEQPTPNDWRQGDLLTVPGEVLQLDSDQLAELGIAAHVIDNVEELKQIYGFESAPVEIRSTWSQELAEVLSSPGISVLLLVIAFCGIYFELHTPGLGIGGFVAALALLLFFWSRMGGSVGWLEILLFVGGMLALLLEVFVLPGLGIFGVGGALMIIASLILAGQRNLIPRTPEDYQELQTSIAVVASAGVLMVIMGLVLRRFLPSIPILNEMLLTAPKGREREELSYRESLAEYSHLVGHRGVTTTPLMPSGRAEFDGELVDVIAHGDAIEVGSTVEVVSARGSRVEVREVQ